MLTSFLFPEYRQKVLGLLLLHPETRYHVREIARLTNTTAGSLHRELSKLAKAQVLIREVSGNQVYYQANSTFPIFEELASILRKTSGLVDVLKNALTPLEEKIAVAFVFGSVGSGTESSGSDVDVLIIGEIGFADAVTALYSAQTIVGREINPKVYKKAEWKKLVNNKNTFAQEILNKPKLFIIGTANDLK
ncbi:MAG TPA: nucleotidyltransferase domain-containing protein [Candidatus Saccharimonadales bacterium]|nr:nucleotidyltransferase domain-containing protein [Candidatus Saccharimonadales bacterium]